MKEETKSCDAAVDRTPTPQVTNRPRRPRIDVVGDDKEVRIYADMPGTDESSIELVLDERTLVLRGTPAIRAAEGMEVRWEEFTPEPYERRFALGTDLARDGIHASVKDGVVEVVIPKAVEVTRTIPVTTR